MFRKSCAQQRLGWHPAEAGSSDVSPAIIRDQCTLAVFVFTVALIWGLQVCWFVFSFNFGDPEAAF